MKRTLFQNRIYISDLQERMFFRAFVTAFAAAFTQTLAVLIDNVIVCACYGETEIAAAALAGPFFYLLEIPAAGLAVGLQTVCAKELGAGRIERVNRLFNQVFSLLAGGLVVLTVLSFLGVRQMAFLFGAREKTAGLLPYASEYLRGLSFEIVPYVLFCVMTPAVILDNGGRLIRIASLLGCVTDIALDLASVRLGWGLFGIGLASSASALVYFLVTLLHFVKRDRVLRLRFVRVRFREIKEVIVSSGPKAWLSLADALRSALFVWLASAAGGVAGTCVLSIHGTISYTIAIAASGIAGANGILAGISCGEKNGEDLKGIGMLSLRYCLILSAAAMMLLAWNARSISAALTESETSANLLHDAIYCVIFTVPFSALVRCRIAYLQAVGKIQGAQWMGIAANLAFPLTGAFLLRIPFGILGVFLAFPAANLMAMFSDWAIHAVRAGRAGHSGEGYLEVDGSFFAAPGDVISYPVETLKDCALASEQAVLFCRGHHLEERKCFLAGLCLEELTTNVVGHGLSGKRKLKTADIRVIIDGGDVILRVRDSGPAFNLKRFEERLEEKKPGAAGSGLRILLGSAGSVAYYRTYGMNTTIIRV